MSDGPDYSALARQLAQAPTEAHARWLQQHDALASVELARALKALYIDAISSDPPLAASAAAALGALAQQLPDAEAQALADWTNGMAALQIEGHAEAAIALVDRAAE